MGEFMLPILETQGSVDLKVLVPIKTIILLRDKIEAPLNYKL